MVTDRMRPRDDRRARVHQVGLPYHWGQRGLTTGGAANDLSHMALDPNVHIQEVKALTCDIRAGRRPRGPRCRSSSATCVTGSRARGPVRRAGRDGRREQLASRRARRRLADTYGDEAKPRVGFFTDTSVCIGCKACEVACKEWNLVPEDGLDWTGERYDNTGELGAEHLAARRVRRAAQRRCGSTASDGRRRPSRSAG